MTWYFFVFTRLVRDCLSNLFVLLQVQTASVFVIVDSKSLLGICMCLKDGNTVTMKKSILFYILLVFNIVYFSLNCLRMKSPSTESSFKSEILFLHDTSCRLHPSREGVVRYKVFRTFLAIRWRNFNLLHTDFHLHCLFLK